MTTKHSGQCLQGLNKQRHKASGLDYHCKKDALTCHAGNQFPAGEYQFLARNRMILSIKLNSVLNASSCTRCRVLKACNFQVHVTCNRA